MPGAVLDHVTLKVADFSRAATFYDLALRPLGLSRLFGDETVFAGYGAFVLDPDGHNVEAVCHAPA